MKQRIQVILILALVLSVLATCQKKESTSATPLQLELDEGELYPGGLGNTVFDQSVNAFGFVSPSIEGQKELLFFVGNSFFNQNWVTAPASTTARDGLGPTFNAKSCSGCHFKDGRGRTPGFEGEMSTGFLLRLSSAASLNAPVPNYGSQFQDQAVLGVEAEGVLSINYEEIPGNYPDGKPYSLRKPVYLFSDMAYGELPADLQTSGRVAQQMIGLGLLEAIPESRLDELADPDDENADGVSGRKNQVYDVLKESFVTGRFGWKANQPTIGQQVAAAFNGDIGITSHFFPNENCPSAQSDCATAENGGAPEIEKDDLDKVILYSSNLAVPSPRNAEDTVVLQGKALFKLLECTSCHVPSHKTGTHEQFENLSDQVIWPYTDLLLHDMGPGLADNRPDGEATGSEWRTQPLWGLGLIPTINGHTELLHDGRARNIEEAILWHGGEAEAAKQRFMMLSQEDRARVIAFLESL